MQSRSAAGATGPAVPPGSAAPPGSVGAAAAAAPTPSRLLPAAGVPLAYRLLLRDPHTPLERFGFHVREPRSRRRVEEIVEAFFTGYNAAVSSRHPLDVRRACEALPVPLHPFAFEGSGMGYGARGMLDWHCRPTGFERWLEAVHPGYRFMYYVGLGIWTGFVGGWRARRVARSVAGEKYRGLVYDGFGFKAGFFHRVRDPQAHRKLEAVPARDRGEAYRGFGRSLWFVFRDDPAGLEAAVTALPDPGRSAAIVGVGLAVVFTSPEDPGAALRRLAGFPAAWQRELERGARLALYVRDAGQPEQVEARLAALPQESATPLRAHLAHARRAYASSIQSATFLHDFTEAC